MQNAHTLEINGQTIHIVFSGNTPSASVVQTPKRQILSRTDLPFVIQLDGTWKNWHVPKRPDQWNEGYAIGKQWFDDVRQLAKVNPQDALNAIRAAGTDLCLYADCGHERGFMDQLAVWAMVAIRSNETLPTIRDGRRVIK